MSDPRVTPAPRRDRRREVHHLGQDVAVANTGQDVLLTTISRRGTGETAGVAACTATRLSPQQARAIGWALIEAAGFVDACG